jgi:hypothetical protein
MSDPKPAEVEEINEDATKELTPESLDDVAGGLRPPGRK